VERETNPTGVRRGYGKAGVGEILLHQLGKPLIVFDEQDSIGHCSILN
jgi:hypothetical protein